MVETFTRSDVFSFSCRLRFSFSLMAGGGLIFFRKLKVSHGIKIFLVTKIEFLVRVFEIFQVVAGGGG